MLWSGNAYIRPLCILSEQRLARLFQAVKNECEWGCSISLIQELGYQ